MAFIPDYYYTVLGIRCTEGPAAIRRAFRRLVVRYHPDRAGEHQARRFQEIVEAYRVLSDPAQREAYESNRASALEPAGVGVRFPVVDRSPTIPRSEPLSLFEDFHAPQSEIRRVFDVWSRNFTHVGVPKAERLKPLDLDVILSPEEAERGTNVSIAVPVLRRCPTCGGSGRDWLFRCIPCGAQGMIEEERVVELQLPQAVAGESVFEVPLQHLGVRNLYLRIRLRVAG